MKPYYESGGVTIYHGDCRDILPSLVADVAITDPPYGIGLVTKTSDYRDSSAFDAGASLRASVLYEDDPVQVRALIRDVIPFLLARVERALVFSGPSMLWAYPEPRAVGCVFTMAGAGRSPWGFQCMHPVLFYGSDPYLQDGLGGRPNSLKDDQPNREHFDHPCPKPIHWMRWAVARASREGETVLDPFMGTGTTLRAAKDLNRRAIGIEIEEKYCEIAAKRLSQEVLDLTIQDELANLRKIANSTLECGFWAMCDLRLGHEGPHRTTVQRAYDTMRALEPEFAPPDGGTQ